MRSFWVDTLATIVFFTVIAATTELLIAGMEYKEILITRLIMIPMMVVTGRPYGIWRDALFNRIKPNRLWQALATDGVAFISFQLPVYAITLMIAGADKNEILTLMVTTAGLMLLISRPFGLYLDYIRAWTHVKNTSRY
jgi:hypothetical protein